MGSLECIKCSTILEPGVNWWLSGQKHKKYICNPCDNKRRLAALTPAQREIRRSYGREYARNNSEKRRILYREYMKREDAKEKKRIRENRRKQYKRQTSLPEEKEEMKLFYLNCPKGYHVDHIVPLCRGGKHIMANLQYLELRDNLQKGSKLLGECQWH